MTQTIDEVVREQLLISTGKAMLKVGDMPTEYRAMVLSCLESGDLLIMSVLGLHLEACISSGSYDRLGHFKRWMLKQFVNTVDQEMP